MNFTSFICVKKHDEFWWYTEGGGKNLWRSFQIDRGWIRIWTERRGNNNKKLHIQWFGLCIQWRVVSLDVGEIDRINIRTVYRYADE